MKLFMGCGIGLKQNWSKHTNLDHIRPKPVSQWKDLLFYQNNKVKINRLKLIFLRNLSSIQIKLISLI